MHCACIVYIHMCLYVYALCIFTCACSTRRWEVYLSIYIYLYIYLLYVYIYHVYGNINIYVCRYIKNDVHCRSAPYTRAHTRFLLSLSSLSPFALPRIHVHTLSLSLSPLPSLSCACALSLSLTQAVLEGTWLLKEESSGTFDVLSCQHTTLVDSAGAVQCVCRQCRCCTVCASVLQCVALRCASVLTHHIRRQPGRLHTATHCNKSHSLTATNATPSLQQTPLPAKHCNRLLHRAVQHRHVRVGVKQVARLPNRITLTQLNIDIQINVHHCTTA